MENVCYLSRRNKFTLSLSLYIYIYIYTYISYLGIIFCHFNPDQCYFLVDLITDYWYIFLGHLGVIPFLRKSNTWIDKFDGFGGLFGQVHTMIDVS